MAIRHLSGMVQGAYADGALQYVPILAAFQIMLHCSAVCSPLFDQRYFYLYFLGELWFAHSRQQKISRNVVRTHASCCAQADVCVWRGGTATCSRVARAIYRISHSKGTFLTIVLVVSRLLISLWDVQASIEVYVSHCWGRRSRAGLLRGFSHEIR
jgi:hypothetical protein